MRIVITGGAGYIGAVAVARFKAAGHYVTIVDNLTYGNEGVTPSVPLIVGDIRNAERWWFEGADAVIHLAGISNDPTADVNVVDTFSTNVDGTIRTAKAAEAAGVKHFIFASSASIYDHGDLGRPPKRFEGDPVKPLGAYSISKYQAELKLHHFCKKNGRMRITALRQGTVFGWSPRLRLDLVVQTMMRSALATGKIELHGGGQFWRPMISIENLAGVYQRVLEQEPYWDFAFRLFNVADGNYPMVEIAQAVAYELRRHERPARVDVIPLPENRRMRNYRMDIGRWDSALAPLSYALPFEINRLALKMKNWSQEQLFAPQYENLRWLAQKAS